MTTTGASDSHTADPTGAVPSSLRRPSEGVGTEVGFQYSPSFPGLLEDLECSLLVSTYQAGQLVAIGVAEDELTLSFRRFDQAMGVAVAADRVAVAGREQVWLLPRPR